MQFFNTLTRNQPKLDPERETWVKNTIAAMNVYDDRRLVRDGKETDSVVEALLQLAPLAGYKLAAVQQLILGQLFFAALVSGRDTSEIAVRGSEWGLSGDEIQSSLATAKSHIEVKPEFINDAPQSVLEAGRTMAKVWQGFNLPAEFVDGTESGLRHYSFKFRIPSTQSFSQYENKLPEVLSHGGIHPELPTIFTRLPFGEFEIHAPKPPSEWRALSFIEYLGQAIEYQPRAGDTLESLVKAICSHYHPKASLHKAPQVTISIDIRGQAVEAHFGSGGIFVGASRMGKSTGMKSDISMLMLMLPPRLFRFAAIDLKNLTFPRFSRDWKNPWMLAPVITRDDAKLLPSLFKGLQQEQIRRSRAMAQVGVESWTAYNTRNPRNPIPFSPLIIDEASLLAKEMGEDEANYWLTEISSLWSCYGMPLIIGTQHPANQNGISPTVRGNLGTKIGYRADAPCAKMAFDSTAHVKAVEGLLGGGDCIVKSPGMLLPVHGQGLDAPEELVDQVLNILRSLFPTANDWFELSAPDPIGDDDLTDAWGCPRCNLSNAAKNGKASNGKQKYKCGGCGHVFTS